jgi:hypothetical protein
MRNRGTIAIVVAVVLIAFATAVISSTLAPDRSATNGHTMPDGSTMQGEDMP